MSEENGWSMRMMTRGEYAASLRRLGEHDGIGSLFLIEAENFERGLGIPVRRREYWLDVHGKSHLSYKVAFEASVGYNFQPVHVREVL